MKTILVPVDFSEEAENALKFAMELAALQDAEVHVFHVVEYPVGAAMDPVGLSVPTPYDADFAHLLSENAKDKMESFLASAGADINYETTIGNPYLNITDKITEVEADLVVMGTKGASGLKEVFVGSNAERIVRTAKCPVITLSQPSSIEDIKDIVFATNVVDVSEQEIKEIKKLQSLFNATLNIVRVNTPNNFERDEVIEKSLNDMAKRFLLKDYTINVISDLYEDLGITAFARKVNAGLIAMGTHGRTGLNHLLSGSVAEDVVNHAKRPIWTFHMA